MMARHKQIIEPGTYKESRVITLGQLHDIEKYDIVLCWKNSTRRELNSLIRKKLGYTSKYPKINEKLVCLKNNYMHIRNYEEDIPIMLVNGLCAINRSDAIYNKDDEYLNMVYSPDFMPDNPFETRVDTRLFDAYYDSDIRIDDKCFVDMPEDVAILDFGYSSTTHRSQGSEWPNVLYIDEFKGSEDMYYRMLYTGITRAKKSITVVRNI